MEIEKLSLHELFYRCKVSQLWTFIVVLAGLISGGFGLGYKIHASVNEAKINSIQLEIVKLNNDLHSKEKKASRLISENKLLNDKDLFMSLYLRYQLAKEKLDNKQDAPELFDKYMTAKDVFDEYIISRVDSEKLKLSKGEERLATIRFDDGTLWTLPRELHAAAKE